MTLRGRLLAGAALGVSLALAVAGAVVYAWTRGSLYAQFDEALEARAHGLADQVELDRGAVTAEVDPEGAPGEAFEIWSRGEVVLRSTSLAGGDLVPGAAAITPVARGGRAARQITVRFLPRSETGQAAVAAPPEVVLVLAHDTGDVERATGRVATVLIGAGALGTLLALAILALVIRVGLAPLRGLAQAIESAELTSRLALADAPAELRPVVTRLNELLARLGLAFARERALTAELAHELRTPLAGIRATIEVAIDRERPAERYHAALLAVLAIAADTERVVEAMLSLARLDAGAARARSAPVEVDEVVRTQLAPCAARAEARGVRVISRLVPVTIASDGEMLRVVIANLLDNAVTYVDDGGTIDVALTADRLVVGNTGCGLPAEAAARVFERFWRGDEARSSGAHAGLGLALCKQLLELLGGAIAVDIAGGRFVATVRLPGGPA